MSESPSSPAAEAVRIDDSFDLNVSALSTSYSSIGGGHDSSFLDSSKYEIDTDKLPVSRVWSGWVLSFMCVWEKGRER